MKKPIIFAGVAAVVLLAAGYFLVYPRFFGGASEPHAEAAEHGEEGEHAAEEEEHAEDGHTTTPAKTSAAASATKKKGTTPEPGLLYPISDRVLNLTSANGVPRYARIELAIEFERPASAKSTKKSSSSHGGGGGHGAPAAAEAEPLDPALEPVEARKVLIDDAIVRVVGANTMESLTTTEGKEKLKEDVLEAVSRIVTSPYPVGVYIVRLVVQ